jgi:glucose/arabinose dehydrogenase
MNKANFFTLFAFLFTFSIVSCQQKDSASGQSVKDKNVVPITGKQKFRVDTLDESLHNPWGIAWLPDGRMLITERSGEILIFKADKNTGEKVSGVPGVFNQGQGGLMDIQLHPDYDKNGWIYISYSKPEAGEASTAIMRAKLQGNQFVEKQDIFRSKPPIDANYHFGSRIVFDKDDYLYVSSGERGTMLKVQQLDNDHGKIHRMYDDGRIPEDNPFVNQKDAEASIWTLGHRNPQGMVYDKANNRIWAVEHGPKGGDELNLIEKGKNYGWPVVTYGIDYDGSIISNLKEKEGIEQPVRYWVPSIAPCGMMLVTSDKYPAWKGNLLIGALAFRYIARVQLSGTSYSGEEKLLENIGRVRHVAQSPDGFIYVLTEGPGMLLKLVPEN